MENNPYHTLFSGKQILEAVSKVHSKLSYASLHHNSFQHRPAYFQCRHGHGLYTGDDLKPLHGVYRWQPARSLNTYDGHLRIAKTHSRYINMSFLGDQN